jgi:hypothetical protein
MASRKILKTCVYRFDSFASGFRTELSGSCEHSDESLGSIKGTPLVDYLNDSQLLEDEIGGLY